MIVRADAYDGIRRDALVRIERRRLRPEGDLEEVQAEVHRAVDEYQSRAHLGDEIPLSDPGEMVGRVLRSITDFGPLTELIARRTGIGELQLVLPALAALSWAGKRIVWLAPPHLPYAPALAGEGIDLARLLVVRAPGRRDALWAAE